MDSTSPKCAICGEILDDGRKTVKITDKGAESVNSASYARENKSIQVQAGQTVHTSCRLDYCNKKSIESAMKRKLHVDVPENRILRSQEPKFTFSTHCFLCGICIDREARDDDFYMVRTWEFQKSIVKAFNDRNDDDEWAEKIRGRHAFAVDLPAVEAIYHQVIDELRENDEQSTVSDLIDRMSKIYSDPYGPIYNCQKLAEHLGDSVVISNINGKDNVVTFRTTAAKILQTFYENPKMNDENAEKQRIINAATEFIKADIQSIETSKLSYPDSDKLGSLEENLAYLPDSLRLLLNNLFTGKPIDLKVATIGQCIVQSTRPRVVLAPIVFGLRVQMHHLYGSRNAINDGTEFHFICFPCVHQQLHLNVGAHDFVEMEASFPDNVVEVVLHLDDIVDIRDISDDTADDIPGDTVDDIPDNTAYFNVTFDLPCIAVSSIALKQLTQQEQIVNVMYM
ncbi:hypothetical protein ScPMuIL_003155 [Solemya velum]